VLDGDPALLSQKGGWSPPISAYVHGGQTAGCIKLALGMEVGLGTGHIVLDGDPAPLPKRKRSPCPIFGPFLLWANGWMHQDATWYGGIGLVPGYFVFDGDPAPQERVLSSS